MLPPQRRNNLSIYILTRQKMGCQKDKEKEKERKGKEKLNGSNSQISSACKYIPQCNWKHKNQHS